jgi:hypothetical protein
MTFDHTAANGGKSYDEASYSLYRNGNNLYHFSNYTTTVSAFQCYLPNSTGAFRLMYGFPGTVYQVRIYNRVLSEAERQQNYFVDLARAFGVSVAGISSLSAEEKAMLFRATAGLGTENGEADRAKLEAFIAFYTGDPEKLIHLAVGYEGLSVRLDTAGIRATFVVDDSVRRALSSRYTVRYGAIMAQEQEGVAISSDLTVTAKDGRFVPNAGSAVTVYSDKGDFGATGLFLERDGDLARFAYTVLPLAGKDWGEVTQRARLLNQGVTVIMENNHTGDLPTVCAGLDCSTKNVIVTAFKRSEDGKGTILRAYETEGKETTATLSGFALPAPLTALWKPFSIQTYYLPDGETQWKEVLLTEFDM